MAGRAAGGIANLVNPEPAVGEQTGGGLVDADGNPIFGLGQEIEPVAPAIQPLQSDEPVRRPEIIQGGGLVEEEEEAAALPEQNIPQRNSNFRLYESIIPEIEGHYTRGRAVGGARGSLPFQITNTTDRKFKGLNPGQTIMIDQVESNGALGYYPRGRTIGSKKGITRIARSELEKHIKAGKLKLDRTR